LKSWRGFSCQHWKEEKIPLKSDKLNLKMVPLRCEEEDLGIAKRVNMLPNNVCYLFLRHKLLNHNKWNCELALVSLSRQLLPVFAINIRGVVGCRSVPMRRDSQRSIFTPYAESATAPGWYQEQESGTTAVPQFPSSQIRSQNG